MQRTCIERMKEDLIRRINDTQPIPEEPSPENHIKFYSPFKTSVASSHNVFDSLSPKDKLAQTAQLNEQI